MSKIRFSVAHGVRLTALALGLVYAQGGVMASPFLTDKPYDLTVAVDSLTNIADYNSINDTVTGGVKTAPLGFGTVEQLFNQTTAAGLKQVNSSYTDSSGAVIRFGYRGIPIVLKTSAGSNGIQMLIPGLNETYPFNNPTSRDANLDALETFLKNSGGDILNRLQQLLAKTSPIDPIAGNPSSMQSRMVSEDFDRNFTQFASNIKEGGPAAGESVNNLIGIGMSYANYSLGGLDSSVITLPLSYTSRPDLDPRRQLTIYMPITVSDVAGAKSYGVNFGVAYRIPVNDEWALTPAVGYGISGSVDLGSAAAMLAASLTSQYTIRGDGYDLAIGNMVGMYQSSKFKVGDYSFDPKISNTVLRNGIMASIPTMVMGKKMAVEISFVNTLYSGTDLYSNQYNEIGVTLGTNKNANSARSYLRAGMTYLQGQNGIKGFRLNVGYWF